MCEDEIINVNMLVDDCRCTCVHEVASVLMRLPCTVSACCTGPRLYTAGPPDRDAASNNEQYCTCTGQAAASPSAQIVCPSICLVISHSL